MDLVHFLIHFWETSHLTWKEAKESQEEIQKKFKELYKSLKNHNLSNGSYRS